MTKQISLTALGLVSAFSGVAQRQETRQTARPNIIHIMTDDHSFQTISAYGHPISKLAPTPNIDRIAQKGMLFTRAYVENSLSAPSRACMLTGLYSHQNGQRRLHGGIDTTKIFFTEMLQNAGYQTAIIGKWHLDCEPKGFDFYKVFRGQGDYYAPEFKTPDSGGRYVREEGYSADLITDHSIDFLEHADKSKPFCLLVHHKAPHRNWMPHVKYLDLYEDIDFPLPETFYDDYATRGSAAHTQKMSVIKDMTMASDLKVTDPGNPNPGILSRLTPEEKQIWKAFYDEKNSIIHNNELSETQLAEWKFQRYLKDYLRCIKSVDESVGRILDYLEQNGLMENTIIVYTSDQGFYMGEHGWFDKRFMYEESFRTPLIISYPQKIKQGSVCSEPVQNIDFAPTYLDMAGLQKTDEMVGLSWAPLFKNGRARNWRQYLYYHYYDYPAEHDVRKHDGVADKRYKLIHFYGQGAKGNEDVNYSELYDLKRDPHEINNVYGNPKYAKVSQRFENQLNKIRKEQKVDEF